MANPVVIAIICTFQRPEKLERCIEGILQQEPPVEQVIVVDNGDGVVTSAIVDRFDRVEHRLMGSNVGPAGGFAAGMAVASKRGADWLWLFNDDAAPRPGALVQCLEMCGHYDVLWPVTPFEPGVRTRSRWVHGPRFVTWPTLGSCQEIELVDFNGLLMRPEVVRTVGYPPDQYFMMFEEIEYALRIRDAGYRVVGLALPIVQHEFAGSVGHSPPWRGYYQTRNHLAMALQHRSVLEVCWWMARQAKYVAWAVIRGDKKRDRIRMRLLGAWHAIRGVNGRVIEPSATETGA